jgi:integral membrane sensor domain MASE1
LLIPYIGTHVSLIWLPTGVALAAYLRWGGAMAPAIGVAALLANLAVGSQAWLAVAIAVGNTLGPWFSALLLRRWRFDAALVRRRDLGFFLAAVMLGMVVTATNGTAWLVAAGEMPSSLWPSAWTSWWIGDSVGALLGGVPLVALNARTLREAFRGARGPVNLALVAGAAGCGVLTFSGAVATG